jgi:hypothetical protein
MRRFDVALKLMLGAMFTIVITVAATAPVRAYECKWRGTAPFCDGECNDDEIEISESANNSNSKFGSACFSGFKVNCCGPCKQYIVAPPADSPELKGWHSVTIVLPGKKASIHLYCK